MREVYMKQIIFSFASLLVFLGIFSACTDVPVIENKTITGTESVVYDDVLYYYDFFSREIRYQNINNVQETGLPLMNDILSSDEENPFINVRFALLLIDENATLRNDNYPILIIAYRNLADVLNGVGSKIITFNTKNNSIKVLRDNIGSIQSLHLYGNTVCYTVNDGELGFNVHTIKTDGSDYHSLTNPQKRGYRVRDFKENNVYLTDEAGNFYSATLELENLNYLFDNCWIIAYFCGNDLYYLTYDGALLSKKNSSD